MLPGLVDGHGHLMLLARARLELNLAAARSEDEIARMVAAAAARLRRGEWITGRGWDQTRWPGQRVPDARLARSRGARASGRAHPRGRPRDVGQRRGAHPRRHHAPLHRSAGRPDREGRRRRAHRDPDRPGPGHHPRADPGAVGGALRPGGARHHRRVPGQGAHRRARAGPRPVRHRVVHAADRARPVPVPRLRGALRQEGLGPLPRRRRPRRSATAGWWWARSSSGSTARSARAGPRCTRPTATIPRTPGSCWCRPRTWSGSPAR